MYAAENDLF